MSMTKSHLQTAILEAERFIAKAESAIHHAGKRDATETIGQSKHNASARRASLDLTRVLAELRKSR